MATNTTKLGLIKPALADVVDVGNLNDNADSIDAAVGFTLCTNATRPATPWAGQVIFETDTGSSFVWDGDSWEAAGGGGGGSITVADTAPSPASAGDLWWNSAEGELYLYYVDVDSSQWVAAAGPSVTVASVAPTGYEGQLWLDDTDGSMYVYYTDPGGGSSWIGAVSRSGGILQVVSTNKTDVFSTNSTSFVDVTGVSATITPRSTNSKILVTLNTGVGAGNNNTIHGRIARDGVALNVGDIIPSSPLRTQASFSEFGWATGNVGAWVSTVSASIVFVDSPATTSSITYTFQVATSGGVTSYVGQSGSTSNSALNGNAPTNLILTEVAG